MPTAHCATSRALGEKLEEPSYWSCKPTFRRMEKLQCFSLRHLRPGLKVQALHGDSFRSSVQEGAPTTFGKTFPKRDSEAKGRNIKEEILQELMKQNKDRNSMNGGDKEVVLGQLPRPPERSRSSSSKSEVAVWSTSVQTSYFWRTG